MPAGAIKTPLNQRRHDNISIVSVERCGKRFEVACYKNKVMDWKGGAEKDVSNVVQVVVLPILAVIPSPCADQSGRWRQIFPK